MVRILLVVLGVLYPFAWYWGRGHGAFAYLSAGMAALWLLRACQSRHRAERAAAAAVAACFAVICALRWHEAMYWYPVLVSALMLLLFGGSLLSEQTVIERLARFRQPDLPPQAVAYTRKVTQVWCVFFVFNGAVCALLVWLREWALWTFYTGVLSYVLMGALFAGEWLVRRRVMRRHQA